MCVSRATIIERSRESPWLRTAPSLLWCLASPSISSTLLDAACDVELLVVGSRGHGGFTGMLLGSVSQHLVCHARCPGCGDLGFDRAYGDERGGVAHGSTVTPRVRTLCWKFAL
jgi:universal stress protein family protein